MDMLMCAFASRYIMVKDTRRVSAAAEMQGAVESLTGKGATQRRFV